MRGGTAVALVLALLVPATFASAAIDVVDGSRGSPVCLDLDVSIHDPRSDEPRRVQGQHPSASCSLVILELTSEASPVEVVALTWSVSPVETSGELALRVKGSRLPSDCEALGLAGLEGPRQPILWSPAFSCLAPWRDENLTPRDLAYQTLAWDTRMVEVSPWGALQRWLRGGLGVEPPAPSGGRAARFDAMEATHHSILLRVRFHAAWSAPGCVQAHGHLEAFADEQRVLPEASPGFFESLCRFSGGAGPSLDAAGPPAAGIAALLLGALALAPLDPTEAALAALAAVEPPQPPDHAAVAGEALAGAAPREGSAEAEGAVEADAGASASVEAALAIDALPEAAPIEAPVEAASPPRAPPAALPLVEGEPAPPPPPAPSSRSEATAPAPAPVVAPPPALAVRVQAVAAREPIADAAALASQAAAAWALLALVGFALYQRLRRPAALDHPARAALYAACVAREDGATVRELAEATGVSRAIAEYHLVYLARLGLLRADRDATRRRRFASPGAPRPEDAPPLAQRVLGVVRARREASLPIIMRALAITRTRADRCVKDLLLEGKLASRWTDEGRVYLMPE